MATLTDILGSFSGARALGDAAVASESSRSDAFRLRAVPNEDVFFFIKRIDNSRVVRQADPRARAGDWKLLGGAGIAAAVLVGVLLPSAWGLMAGYQLSRLQNENVHLSSERTRLEVEEARLVSVERLQQLADMQKFVDPSPDSTVYLPKAADNSLARLDRR